MEECIMKDEYDFTKARKNPYAKKLKQQITISTSFAIAFSVLRNQRDIS